MEPLELTPGEEMGEAMRIFDPAGIFPRLKYQSILVFESALSSPESAASTSDSNAPDTESSGNASPTPGGGRYSPTTGPQSPAVTTFVKAQKAHDPDDCERWEETDQTNTLSPRDGTAPATLVLFTANQRDEVRELNEAASLSGQGSKQTNYLLISSAEDSPAKTSPSPDAAPDSSAASGPASSLSSPASPTLFSPLEAGSSLRTYPDYFPPTTDATSPSYSRRWPRSGFTTSPGECWTADTSECPNGAAASSSLADVLEDEVPARYFLSPRAAAGILRRAEARGKALPTSLREALTALANTPTRSDRSPTAATEQRISMESQRS